MDGLNLLKWTRFNIFSSIPVLQEGLRNSDLEAILGVREVDSQLFQATLHVIRLNQARIGTVRLKHRTGNLTLLPRKHHISYVMRVVPFHLFLKSTIILDFTIFINILKTVF
jgi:hypothetical protein